MKKIPDSEKDTFYMVAARRASVMSRCQKVKVGAVAVRNNDIIAFGYNASFDKAPHCDEVFSDDDGTDLWARKHAQWSECFEVHAEQQLLIQAMEQHINLKGATVYVTLQPCNTCLKLLIAAGVSRIVYKDKYPKSTWTEYESIICKTGVSIETFTFGD